MILFLFLFFCEPFFSNLVSQSHFSMVSTILLHLLLLLQTFYAQEHAPTLPLQPRLDVQCVADNNLLLVGHHDLNENILIVRLLDGDNDISTDQIICVRSNDKLHSNVCSPIHSFYYPLSQLSNHGFGLHSISVFLASSSLDVASSLLETNETLETIVTIDLQLNIADALYSSNITTTKTSIETSIELTWPKKNMRSGDGRVKIEVNVVAWPTHGSTCLHVIHASVDLFNFEKMNEKEKEKEILLASCNKHSMRNWLTNVPPGKYKVKSWIRNEQEEILDTTGYVLFEVLNGPKVVEDYHIWYTDNLGATDRPHPKWNGVPVQKSLTDLFTFQEIIVEYQFKLFVEFGSLNGGSALYVSQIMSMVQSEYHVLSVDIDTSFIHEKVRNDPNIEILEASSVSIVAEQRFMERITEARPGKVMVTLDSAHSMKHVLAEMHMVTRHLLAGDYLVVEDTHHNFHPYPFSDDNGPGPFEAVEEFDRMYPNEYVHDTDREKRFGFTWNPRGYLIKQ